MSTWLVPFEELTPDQLRAVELNPYEHRIIFGAPGSGKTMILLHRAKYLQQNQQTPPERMHIFVFTKVLKDYIKSALHLLDLPIDSVSTFDSWCANFYKEKINPKVPWNKEEHHPDFQAIRKAVFEKIRNSYSGNPIFNFILVDEGQDLDEETFDLMRLMSKHITVCMDHKQQIYERGSNETSVLRRLGLRKANMTLLGAYRCCPYIVTLASEFIKDENEKTNYVRQAKTEQTERETPLLYLGFDFEDEMQRLSEITKVRLAKGDKIAIIVAKKRQAFGIAKGLSESGIEVETMNELDFTNNNPKIMTYHSAKGLTFDSVLLPLLNPGSFSKVEEDRIRRLLFVGITRAMKWAYLSKHGDKELSHLNKFLINKPLNFITIQEGTNSMDDTETSSNDCETSSFEDDDLLNLL